jgi:hypothetical protein
MQNEFKQGKTAWRGHMKNNHVQFGPWTTRLHYGNRLELSAFWRLRLGRLASLATSGERTNWPTTFALCVAAGLLIIQPLVRLDASQRGEKQSAVATAKQQAAGGQPLKDAAVTVRPQAGVPFTGIFSNGVKVQLVGLSENPSKGRSWWAPDGTQLHSAPYDHVPADMRADESQLAREICYRWINKPDDPDFETGWDVSPRKHGCGGGIAFDADGKKLDGFSAWAVAIPDAQDTFTLRFSVSIRATPWSTVFANEGRNLSAMSRVIDGVPHGVIFGEPHEDKRGTSITVSHQIPGKAVRLLAVDNHGLPSLGTSTGGAGSLGFSQVTYRYADLTPDKIERFELQSQKRLFETIEFRNVSLHPNHRTEVEIVRLTPEGETSQSNVRAAAPAGRARIVAR